MDRVALLTEVLAQNPTDAFARYGLAMEYSNSGQVERALEEFGRLLATHPDYTAGYFMAAQTHLATGSVQLQIADLQKLGRGRLAPEMNLDAGDQLLPLLA